MCTEPETLIPLVGFSPNVARIILIGDHMQLQPIIKCRAAKRALLDRSLFQRYAERDDVSVIMLTEQYRMVRIMSIVKVVNMQIQQENSQMLNCRINTNMHRASLPAAKWHGNSFCGICLSVCLSVCNMITFESFDVEFSILVRKYIFWEYVMNVIGSRSQKQKNAKFPIAAM